MDEEKNTQLPHYRVIQLEWDAQRGFRNEAVEDFDSLVMHHPQSNRGAHLVNGAVVGGPPGRAFGVIGGEIQEIEVARGGRDFGLRPDQVLVKKDFILEDPRLATGPGSRALDVPSPVSGVVGVANARSGLVDVLDREGGEVILRVRHMSPLHVQAGDRVEYGQALGVQSNQATQAVHVHMEVDSRYYQQYENYVEDLVSGRLPIDATRQTRGIDARPVVDDGTIRIGESSDVVQHAQRVLNAEGFRGVDGQPLQEDGVYRLSMQPAVINYQQARGLPPTGDLDPATLQQIAPRVFPPELNRQERDAPSYLERHGGAAPDPLHRQAEQAVRVLEQGLGRDYDANSAKLAASAACLAKENGLSRIDHVVLSENSRNVRAGENLFVVQGALNDPAHLRAHMRTEDALSRSVDQSLAQLQSLSETQRQPKDIEQPDQVQAKPHQMV
ncbi:peptidoglycan-binding protein [Xanthomonas sacchari]|uniref:XVIPCD domain-containing protein n=2 Tax=Xanthomonas TaxID=338 RepID=UPI0003A6C031|nr:XVIPCD domain-containing protein [Xanthomonas sp. SHU 308]UYK84508.1 peptidoglycan-binding protein [Xanthomonas sacchari]